MSVDSSFGIWTGFKLDFETEKFMANDNQNDATAALDLEKDTNLVWRTGEPNGGELEPCIVFSEDRETIMDITCRAEQYTTCNINSNLTFTLHNFRNLQSINLHLIHPDFIVHPGATSVDEFHLKGYNGHKIVRNDSNWEFKTFFGKTVLTLHQNELPLGLKKWKDVDGKHHKLNINACTKDEFGCNDGICIERFYRCNHIIDCENAEDEHDCVILRQHSSYDYTVPTDSLQKIVSINVNIGLLNILRLIPDESMLTVQFQMMTSWSDERLKFSNLQSGYNIIQHRHWRKIWIPNFLIEHTTYFDETANLPSEPTSLVYAEMKNESDFTFQSEDNGMINFNFEGDSVKIYKFNKYTVELICDFNWQAYPFDIQMCKMSLVLLTLKSKHVNLIPNVTNRISEFRTFSVKLENYSIGYEYDVPKILITLKMKRDFTPLMLNTFLPTILLTLINQLTNYFKEFISLEGNIAITATILMTLGSIFISTFNSVPSSTYIKMMDVWMIVVLIYPVILICAHALQVMV